MKMKLLFCAALLGVAVSMNGQTLYVPSGTGGIGTSTNGNVGIGTTSPSNKLHIIENAQTEFYGTDTPFPISNLILQGNSFSRTVGQGPSITFSFPANTDGGNSWSQARILASPDNANNGNAIGRLYFQVRDWYNPGCGGSWNWRTGLMIAGNGNVGIGTTSPTEKLHVLGNSIITGTIKAGVNSGTITQTANYPYSTTIETGADAGQILINAGSTSGYVSKINISGSGNGTGIQFYTKSAEIMRVSDGGNVLIGKTTQTNTTYKLDVAGKIRADEITVNTTGADFVFEPTYKLRTLSEVEAFIKANKHLPEVAPAADMQTNGVSMGDMQAKLLQKVEELTLYVIEQDKAKVKVEEQSKELQRQVNATLESKVAEQDKKLDAQAKEIEELKQLINQKLK